MVVVGLCKFPPSSVSSTTFSLIIQCLTFLDPMQLRKVCSLQKICDALLLTVINTGLCPEETNTKRVKRDDSARGTIESSIDLHTHKYPSTLHPGKSSPRWLNGLYNLKLSLQVHTRSLLRWCEQSRGQPMRPTNSPTRHRSDRKSVV